MDSLIFILGASGIVGLMFLLWLYTPKGKKWLANL
jgi:hypothetical protein